MNEILPLGALCLLERDTTNHIERIQLSDCIGTLMTQCHIPEGSQAILTALRRMDQLSTAKLYRLGCTMEDEAALVSYRALTS